MEIDGKLNTGESSDILIEVQGFVEEKSKVEIATPPGSGKNGIKCWDEASLKEKYCYISEKNKYLEKAIAEFGGRKALKEIEGIYSLDEVPELWEKVNNQ